MARTKNSSKPTGAQLRALREARAVADSKVEAQRRETSLLKSLSTAREDFDWFVSTQAWTHLGYETFTGWWLAKVQPVADGLMKPVRDVARTAMDLITEEQKALPPAQRLRQRDIAAAVGASQATVSRRTRDADASDVDLEESTNKQVGAHSPRDTDQEEPAIPPAGSSTRTAVEGDDIAPTADGAEGVDAFPPDDTPAAAGGEEASPPAAVTPADSPAPVSQGVQPIATASGRESGLQPAAAPMVAPVAGSPEQIGNVEGSALPVDLSTQDHPLATGEAPADGPSTSPGAGAQPSSSGEALGDETPEGSVIPPGPDPSGVDPEDEIGKAERWLATVDLLGDIDIDVLAEVALDELVARLDVAAQRVATWNALFHQWRKEYGYEKAE